MNRILPARWVASHDWFAARGYLPLFAIMAVASIARLALLPRQSDARDGDGVGAGGARDCELARGRAGGFLGDCSAAR